MICDEITASLDVSVQASVVRLLADLQRQTGMACLFVTHDLNLVRIYLLTICGTCEVGGSGPSGSPD